MPELLSSEMLELKIRDIREMLIIWKPVIQLLVDSEPGITYDLSWEIIYKLYSKPLKYTYEGAAKIQAVLETLKLGFFTRKYKKELFKNIERRRIIRGLKLFLKYQKGLIKDRRLTKGRQRDLLNFIEYFEKVYFTLKNEIKISEIEEKKLRLAEESAKAKIINIQSTVLLFHGTSANWDKQNVEDFINTGILPFTHHKNKGPNAYSGGSYFPGWVSLTVAQGWENIGGWEVEKLF